MLILILLFFQIFIFSFFLSYIIHIDVFSVKDFSAYLARLGMSVTTQGGSGRQYVTGPGRNISKYRFVVLNVYRFRET